MSLQTSSTAPQAFIAHAQPPRMTLGRAALLKLMACYSELDYSLGKTEIQTLGYFLQVTNVLPDLAYVRHIYGPFSTQMDHALERMKGHYITTSDDPDGQSEIHPTHRAQEEANAFLIAQDHTEHLASINRVSELIDGYQTPYGLELLATVHWIAHNAPHACNADEAVQAAQAWSERKARVMRPEHIHKAWHHLVSKQWI